MHGGKTQLIRLLFDAEMVLGAGLERLTGTEHRAREVGTVRRIGIVLCFKSNAGILAEILSGRLGGKLAVHVLRTVHLHAGFGRLDEERTARNRIAHKSSVLELAIFAAKHKVVIVPIVHRGERSVGLHEIGLGADGAQFREVETGAGNGSILGRNETFGRLRILVGENLEFLIEDVSARFTCEVPVGMVREVENGGLIGRRLVLDGPDVVGHDLVRDLACHGAREAHLAVLGDVSKLKTLDRTHAKRLDVPNLLIPALRTTMKVAMALGLVLVDRQLVFLAVERELAVCNAVTVATDERTGGEAKLLVLGGGVPTEGHVSEIAVLVRRIATHKTATIVGDVEDESTKTAQTVHLGFTSISKLSETHCAPAHRIHTHARHFALTHHFPPLLGVHALTTGSLLSRFLRKAYHATYKSHCRNQFFHVFSFRWRH